MEKDSIKEVFENSEALGQKVAFEVSGFVGKHLKKIILSFILVGVAILAFLCGSFFLKKKKA